MDFPLGIGASAEAAGCNVETIRCYHPRLQEPLERFRKPVDHAGFRRGGLPNPGSPLMRAATVPAGASYQPGSL